VAGTCEYGDELSGSIKCGEFLDLLLNQLASQEGLCSMDSVSKYCYCYHYRRHHHRHPCHHLYAGFLQLFT